MVARAAIISATVVVIVMIAAVVGVLISRRRERQEARRHGYALRGDLNRQEEKALVAMLDEAATILRGLGRNDDSNYGDPEIIRADTRIDVGRWLRRYDNVKDKVSQ